MFAYFSCHGFCGTRCFVCACLIECLQMSLSANRREVVAGAAAAAVVAPMLRPTEAKALDNQLLAPIITIFDHRG